MKILRVFPHRTRYTPIDRMAVVGMPKGIIPDHDEIHISCLFTWDKPLCEQLAISWRYFAGSKVTVGGPAYNSPTPDFVPGVYVKPGIIFTSRGCNNHCPWCMVPRVEGPLRELEITPGNVIQDNNLLQTSRSHQDKVFSMLEAQSGICFKGGFEAALVDERLVERLSSLKHDNGTSRVKEIWLACDTDNALPIFRAACEKLSNAGFTREKIHCYVLSYGKDMRADEARARAVYNAGAMPFMQLYRDFSDRKTQYSKEWNAFARMWQRPAATRMHMEQGTDFRDFNT